MKSNTKLATEKSNQMGAFTEKTIRIDDELKEAVEARDEF